MARRSANEACATLDLTAILVRGTDIAPAKQKVADVAARIHKLVFAQRRRDPAPR